jgi:ribosome biogenesis GTPase
VAFIIQSVNRDFTVNRLERYLTICYDGGIQPIILLSKIDLIDSERLTELLEIIKARITDIPVIPLSNVNGFGVTEINMLMQEGKTYCLLGSSGVGKSSLINALSGNPIMKTGEISSQIDRGKHVTTHRELIVLPNRAIIIDNPGMREVGISDASEGLSTTFETIEILAEQCKFRNCTHTNESGCAILEAIQSGDLSNAAYENFKKMEREQAHFTATVKEKRDRDRKFGKMVNEVKRFKKQTKYK